MELAALAQDNLLSPMVLAFVLGAVAAWLRSDLRFPDGFSAGLSIYLLLAIGLKGGVALSETSAAEFWAPALVTLGLGVGVPVWCYAILRRLGRCSVADAAALAAHYGSVSAVTFLAGLSFLDAAEVSHEGYLPSLVALLEIPGIVVALLLARRASAQGGSLGEALHEVLTGKSIVLLAGGVLIGYLAGRPGFDKVAPLFVAPFQGVLTLFLLEMGLLAARRFGELRRLGPFLGAFGVVMPIVHALLGVLAGTWAGMSVGGATVLGLLAASASYIAAPAAVRIALPAANPSYYLTASLAITFPFNLTIGIPLYYAMARWVQGAS